MKNTIPKVILLLSGKRKSGKDYISEKLLEKLTNELCVIVRISEPIKSHYAKTFNLDLEQLLSDGAYKEKYRLDMIRWSEEIRKENYGYFCQTACDNAVVKPIWIVSDIRRKSDIKWFNENYGLITKSIRINAMNSVRETRGWTFTAGVDDVKSECDLDDLQSWDYNYQNNNHKDAQIIIESVYNTVKEYL